MSAENSFDSDRDPAEMTDSLAAGELSTSSERSQARYADTPMAEYPRTSDTYPRTGDSNRYDTGRHEAADILAVIWRYRWAVVLPMIVGAFIGFGIFSTTPETFKSQTRLIVESDRPAVLDAITGDIYGGVPGVDIIRSQLMSDHVVEMAYEDNEIKKFHSTFTDSKQFAGVARGSLTLYPELVDSRSANSVIMMLGFENTDRELCNASVEAFSNALRRFFNERQKSNRSELIDLIEKKTEQLYPKLEKLEEEYSEFRRTASLAWDDNGEAINPHRQEELRLLTKRSELNEELRAKSILLASVESIADKRTDPTVALGIIGQLLDVPITTPEDPRRQINFRDGDEKLALLEIEQQLVPTMIDRNKYAAEFGDSHPTVRQLDAELTFMKSEMRRLVKEQTDRIVELMKESRQGAEDPSARARESVNAVLIAANAEHEVLKSQLDAIEEQIASERALALKLAKDEQENASKLRKIEQVRELMDQLDVQMQRAELTEEEGGTNVIELTAPTAAYQVGPNLTKSLGVWTCIGLAFGVALALMLEKNANTFRDPEEIAEMLGVTVLTHIPYFRGRVRKAAKGEINPYKGLDPHLAVIHSPASIAAEAIRSCRTSIFFEASGSRGNVIQVTSPLPGDGKSTIAGNLACSIAQSGKSVLAIDCDLRRPQLTENFALADAHGLTHVLNGECEVEDASHSTPLPTLRLMPSGPIPANPAEALTLPEMHDLLEVVREKYDYVIIDTPPLLVVTDPSIMASLVDGVILALRVRRKSKPNARESINILRAVRAKVLGIVINNSDESSASDGYRGYGYYRYGRYANRYYRTGSGDKKSENAPVFVSGRGVAPIKHAEVIDAQDVSEANPASVE